MGKHKAQRKLQNLQSSELGSIEDDICIELNALLQFCSSHGSSLKDTKIAVYLHKNSGNILCNEAFEFIHRKNLNNDIVRTMKYRQEADSGDKVKNPILALAGSPGSGKTSFLINFPLCTEFVEFLTNHYEDSDPIVSILIFNGAMSQHPHLLGKRILFGAALAMGLLDTKENSLWRKYCKETGNTKDVSVEDAVEILQRIFGANRPVFIGVDELSKSDNHAKEHITRIGSALDDLRCMHVIVTSLSPAYIQNLVTGSNRLINYFIPEPLLENDLGKKECRLWAQSLIDEAMIRIIQERQASSPTISVVKTNLLKNMYLIYSGHPRSLDLMVTEMKRQETKITERKVIIDNLINNDRKLNDVEHLFSILLNRFRKDIPEHTFTLYEPHDLSQITERKVLDDLVLQPGVTCSLYDEPFRMLVEKGTVLIDKKLSSSRFQPTVSLFSILDLLYFLREIDKASITTPNLKTASLLFRSVSSLKLSNLWERMIIFSLIGHSNRHNNIADLIGVNNVDYSFLHEEDDYELALIIPTKDSDLNSIPSRNSVYLPYQTIQPGYDGRITVYPPSLKSNDHNLPLWIYIQVKLAKFKKDINQVIADLIINILEDHGNRLGGIEVISLERILIVFYNWGYKESQQDHWKLVYSAGGIDPRKQLIKDCVDRKISTSIKSSLKSVIDTFIDNYYETNVFILGQADINAWILPGLRAFPRLLSAIEDDENRTPEY